MHKLREREGTYLYVVVVLEEDFKVEVSFK